MKFSPPPEESNYLEQLDNNATEYFRKKFPNTICIHGTQWATFPDGQRVYFKRKFYQDEQGGIKYRVIAIDDLGMTDKSINVIAQYDFSDAQGMRSLATGRNVPTDMMTLSPRIFIYTNKMHCELEHVIGIFRKYQPNVFIEVIDESQLHKTLFISYGTLDEEFASRINEALISKGIQTWFFPKDAVPGDKLHRMMSEGVYKYDRSLLICSESSVTRGGVLNEIERLLEREASEGGADIIIPVALDNYIFTDWMPEREDIKRQITSRVVSKINDKNFNTEVNKIVSALIHN